MAANSAALLKLKEFLPKVEGFSALPVWDFKQWSWGYGTAAGYDKTKKPAGSITREQAWQEALKVINANHEALQPLITAGLNPGQWAALLSFAYNLGAGNAKKLIPNINTGNQTALENQWKKYVVAGGKVNQGLISRRNKEWEMWAGKDKGSFNPMFLFISLLFH